MTGVVRKTQNLKAANYDLKHVGDISAIRASFVLESLTLAGEFIFHGYDKDYSDWNLLNSVVGYR